MEAKVIVEITTDWLQTGFKRMVELSNNSYHWDTVEKKCHWRFPIERIKEVEAILGKPIEFQEGQCKVVESRTPCAREETDVPEFKGKSGIVVEDFERIFVVTEYRKVENEEGQIEVKLIRHEVPLENVNVLRQALQSIDETRFKDGRIPPRRIQEKTLQLLGIDRFNRSETGTFDGDKFFGARTDYGHYYYYPLKVLVYKGEVIHHKRGGITKLLLQTNVGEFGNRGVASA